jgi:hypothetical protein
MTFEIIYLFSAIHHPFLVESKQNARIEGMNAILSMAMIVMIPTI